MSELLETQNRVIIALLARSTIGIEEIEKIVTFGKKEGRAGAYVGAYNALDGTRTATEIAGMIGVSKQAIGKVFQTWEREGIVYKDGKNYVGLLKLPTATESKNTDSNEKSGESNANQEELSETTAK